MGRRLELGANTYRVLVPPTPPQAGFGATSTFGSRADPRERGPPCVIQVKRVPVAMAVLARAEW